jgi:eukaryotic-like serine/threonine-protein kinase
VAQWGAGYSPPVAEAAPAVAEFKPHLFGKFFLLQRLAMGGMAEIYRARVPGTGGFEKELVVKRILPARAQDHGFIKMLVNEAKLTVQLTHSNIAQVYECGRIAGTYFISMELVNGVSMKEMMTAFARAGQALSPEQAIFMVLQLLTGLDYAHKKTDSQGRPLQVVHCDVSPDNALVSWEGEIKLLDFGIARAATGLSNYKEGMLMGKLGYVAPEQASLDRTWDHRVDIFAAGILLYELLTKQKPFPKATDVESLVLARKAKVVPPTAIDPRLPRELDAILAKALAYDPDRRYADARSFADALVDVLFPTPQSSIQDLLGKQMQSVFAEKIARQRNARAHDPLIMKVLANVAEREVQAEYERLSALPSQDGTDAALFEPPAATASELSTTDTGRHRARPPSRPRTIVKEGVRVRTALLLGLLAAGAATAGLHYGEIWLRPGVLVVTSEPAGAAVFLDGAPTGQVTPAVLEGVVLSRPHELALEGAGVRGATLAVEPLPGQLVRRIHAPLRSALGAFTVRSVPPGAEVRVDDRAVGTAPVTVSAVRMDERHRVDLTLPGYELDQFVVLPEQDGTAFSRTLARTAPPVVPAAAPAPRSRSKEKGRP